MDDRTHEVLLALAGRIDDDLLAWCRELVAVGEDGRALELITATLAADGTTLPPQNRAALVDAARAARTDLDADAVLRPGGTVDDTPHRFDAGRGIEDLAAAVGALPERLVAGCRTWVTFRSTPAGSAPGPLPQPVVLVEVAADDPRPLDVLAYQLATACARVGAPSAAVEVVVAGAARPGYQQAAVENALPVHGADSAPHTDPYGTAVYRPDPWDAPADTDSFAVQEPVDGPAVEAPAVDAPAVDAPAVDAPYLDAPRPDAPRPDAPPSDAPHADAAYADAAAVEVPSVDVPDDERAAAWPALGSLVMPPGPRPVARRSPFPDAGLPSFALSPSDVDESGAGAGPIDPPSGDDERVPTEQTDGVEPRPEPEGPFGGTGAGESFGDAGPSTTTGGLRPFGSSVESGPLDWTPGTDLLAPTDLTQSDLVPAADEPAVGSAAPEPVSAVDDAPIDEIRTGGGRGAPTGDAGDRSAPVTPLRARTEPPRPRPTAVPPLPRPMPSPTPFGRRRPLMPVSDPPVRSLPVASAAADTPALASIGDPFSGPIEERTSPMSSSRREPTIDEADPLGLGRLPVERHPDDDDFPIELPDSSAADSWLADWISGDWAMSRSGSSPDPLGSDSARVDSARSDSARSDSARSDSARSDSAGSDSSGRDAARPDSAASPVAAVGSSVADPGSPDPARRDPAPRRTDAPDPFVGRVEERAAPGPSASAGRQPDRSQPDRPLPDRWIPDRPVPAGPPSDRSLSDGSLSDGPPSDGLLSGGPMSDRRPPDRSLPERRVPGRSFPVRSVPFAPDRSGPVEPPADQPPSVRRPAPRPVPAPQAETPMEQTSFVLPPESVARLSDADRELLARLQSELGDTPRPRVTRRAGIGGNGAPAPNGRGPHPSTPPDMAG